MRELIVVLIAIFVMQISSLHADIYNRDDFNYRSYKPSSGVGFYTGEYCRSANIDHGRIYVKKNSDSFFSLAGSVSRWRQAI